MLGFSILERRFALASWIKPKFIVILYMTIQSMKRTSNIAKMYGSMIDIPSSSM